MLQFIKRGFTPKLSPPVVNMRINHIVPERADPISCFLYCYPRLIERCQGHYQLQTVLTRARIERIQFTFFPNCSLSVQVLLLTGPRDGPSKKPPANDEINSLNTYFLFFSVIYVNMIIIINNEYLVTRVSPPQGVAISPNDIAIATNGCQ